MAAYRYPTAFSSWGAEEHEAIRRVIMSDRFTMGPEVAAFEREFADYHGRAHGVMVNSGSSANLIATASLFHHSERPLKPGMKAVAPAIAWSTTYAPLIQHGLEVTLVDVDDAWNADVYSRTFDPPKDAGLFVGCSILGLPADLQAMKDAAAVHGAWFIEDNCESLGARRGTRLCGTFGDLSTFSFFHSHQISAIEGGMILTDDDQLAALCRVLRAHGWTRDVKQAQTFEEEYEFVAFGYNVRPVEIHAAVAREQLKKLEGFNAQRRKNRDHFLHQMRGLPSVRVPVEASGCLAAPFGLHFEVAGGSAMRAALVTALRTNGVDCRLPTGGSFVRHPYGSRLQGQSTPNADCVHDCGLFIGNGAFDLTHEIDRVARIIVETLQ